jgi:glycosyltransferase involved in cell wall biosynthesis
MCWISVRSIPSSGRFVSVTASAPRIERLVWSGLRRAADHTILVSRACWSDPRGVLPPDVHVIHNGFAVPAYMLAISQGNIVTLGFAGRIHPSKGLHTLIEALRQALVAGTRVHLIVRGAFASETPGYRGEIEKQIAAGGLEKFVRFEGFVSDPEAVYRDITVVCVPSTTPDPLPRSVMEAMGRGLCVVGTRSGGIPEMIVDGENGFLADTPEAIAAVIARLGGDPELRRLIGLKAREHSIRMFAMERLHREVLGVYDSASPVVPKGAG